MTDELEALQASIKEGTAPFIAAKKQIASVIVGQSAVIDRLLIGLLANGHLLIEGMPGLAKTLAVTTLAEVIQCDFKRIQFTPDLLPADLIGTSIYNPEDKTFKVSKGPIFTQLLLADEINRAPAKVQSALLEVMQERQVTIAGSTYKMSEPYLVVATQNPIDHEGTYALPEAQTDRFMMQIKIDYPTQDEEQIILKNMGTLKKAPKAQAVLTPEGILSARNLVDAVYVDDKVVKYILDIVFATRYPEKFDVAIKQLLMYGASPRASIAFKLAAKAKAFLEGRAFVIPEDIKHIAPDILRHRLRRTYEAEAEVVSTDDIVDLILQKIPLP